MNAVNVELITRQRETVSRRLRETPLGFCFRVIVNEFHQNLEKTTSSVPSVILINLRSHDCSIPSQIMFYNAVILIILI